MNLKKHIRLFNRISGIYDLFFNYQVAYYSLIVEKNIHRMGGGGSSTLLDIGCGTGAFAYAFIKNGREATGADAAFSMLRKAKNRGIPCINCDASSSLPFKDKSFDFVTAAFVAHGLDYQLRMSLFREASRLARSRVIIHDFGVEKHLFTAIIEYLEGGDYFNFIADGAKSMEEVFSQVEIVTVAPNNVWYICTP